MKRFFCVFLLLALLTVSVSAADLPYIPSTYNEWGDTVTGASGYRPAGTVDGNRLGVGSWSEPTDMAVSPDGYSLFVLDAGNNRVVYTDATFQSGQSIDVFRNGAEETQLSGATGLYCDGDSLYIADKGNARVIRCDRQGNITGLFEKPESVLFPQDKQFLPTKVAADTNGVVYVICEGIDQGAVMYDPEGEFLGYIGSNKIQTTLAVMLNNVIKKLVSKEAQDNMAKYTPVEFSNLTIDRENFLYTCTDVQDVTQKLKKLNSSSVNILATKVDNSFQKGFGNINPPYVNGSTAHSRFVDVAVDEAGTMYGLDFTNMRVFSYDRNANLLFSFGGPGTQEGLFLNPVAVEVLGDRVLVLDTNVCQITLFEKTEFGALVEQAMGYYQDGEYEQSVGPWQDVLKYNSNYTMAYIGLGKAYLELGQIEKALDNFEVAHYESGYNEAYRILRVDQMRANFPLYFVVILLLLFLIYGRKIPVVKRAFAAVGVAVRGRTATLSAWLGEKPWWRFIAGTGATPTKSVWYTALHPIEGFREMRYKRAGSMRSATISVVLLFVALFAKEQLFGFAFRVDVNPEDLNLPLLLALSVGLCLLFTLINWGICTMFDGSGRLKDIWVVTGYAIAPYIAAVLLAAVVSQFLTSEEAVFIEAIQMFGALYSAFLLIKGIEAYHEYSFGGSILSILCTLAGILLTVLLGILLFSIAQQFVAFVATMYQEIQLRMR